MSARYEQVLEGEWYRWDRKNNLDRCCSCCLTHRIDYRIVRKGNKQYIESKVWIDRRATAAARKRAGIKVSGKKR